jgi:hypothetical protein
MKDAAPAKPAAASTDVFASGAVSADAVPEGRARIQCYAETTTGIHAISLEAGLRMFERCRQARAADEFDAPLVWIDVASPGEAEAVFLRDQLHFHPLAVEDCIRGRQRPKLDRYPGYYFLVLYSAVVNAERNRMALHEVHIFLGRRYLVTVHDHKDQRVRRGAGALAGQPRGVPHGGRAGARGARQHRGRLLSRARALRRAGGGDRDGGVPRRREPGAGAHPVVRREMALFRKVLGPERDVLSTMLRRDLPFLSSPTSSSTSRTCTTTACAWWRSSTRCATCCRWPSRGSFRWRRTS